MARGIFGRLFSWGAGPASPPAPPERMIRLYNPQGEAFWIPLSEWRTGVLPAGLKSAWDNPPELYSLILGGLEDDLAGDLEEASARLAAIDPIAERGATIRGIVLMKLGRLDEAEAALRAGMARAGETGALLTNLAKVQFERGDQTLAADTLWRGVQADPNLENGLLWWLSIQEERGGDEAWREGLRVAAQLSGAWRPQLWLARACLDDGKLADAMALYRQALSAPDLTPDALTMVSGDLGQRGHAAEALEIVSPLYDPAAGDIATGLNLLQCCEALGRGRQGAALVEQLLRLDLPPLRGDLEAYSLTFARMAGQ